KGEIDKFIAKRQLKHTEKTEQSNTEDQKWLDELPEQPISFDIQSINENGHPTQTHETVEGVPQYEVNAWIGDEREKLKIIVEQVMQPLVEKISSQAALLAEKDRIIEEQATQLRLLPDLEKQASAEREARESIVTLLNERTAILEQETSAHGLSKAKVGE